MLLAVRKILLLSDVISSNGIECEDIAQVADVDGEGL